MTVFVNVGKSIIYDMNAHGFEKESEFFIEDKIGEKTGIIKLEKNGVFERIHTIVIN